MLFLDSEVSLCSYALVCFRLLHNAETDFRLRQKNHSAGKTLRVTAEVERAIIVTTKCFFHVEIFVEPNKCNGQAVGVQITLIAAQARRSCSFIFWFAVRALGNTLLFYIFYANQVSHHTYNNSI